MRKRRVPNLAAMRGAELGLSPQWHPPDLRNGGIVAIVRQQLEPKRKPRAKAEVKSRAKPKRKAKAEQGAGERRFTPQQIEFGLRYFLPTSPTFGNAYQSAIKAGYSESYAKRITASDLDWLKNILSEIIRNYEKSDMEVATKEELVRESKRVISETLKGADKTLAQKSAVFVLKSDPEFSEKRDLTSGGEKIETPPIALVEFVDGNPEENPV